MKKSLSVLFTAIFVFSLTSFVFAADKKVKPPKGLSEQQKTQIANNAKETLAAQEWLIYLTHTSSGKKVGVLEQDTLVFAKEGKISSKYLNSLGYSESNYTLNVLEDGTPVWETMQVSEDGSIAFIRGELKGAVLKGALSVQPKKGMRQSYAYTSEAPVAQVQAQQPVKAQAKEETPKKK